MPSATYPVSPDGLIVQALLGLRATDVLAQMAAGSAVTRPIRVVGTLDTGTTVSAVSAAALARLGLSSVTQTTTQTFGGLVSVNLFDVSVSITQPGWAPGPSLAVPDLTVMEFPQPLHGVDLVVGLDVLLQCRLDLDGPAGQFTVVF